MHRANVACAAGNGRQVLRVLERTLRLLRSVIGNQNGFELHSPPLIRPSAPP